MDITEPDAGPPVCVTATNMAHSSVAVGIDQFNLPLHWSGSLPIITIVVGQLSNTGGMISDTVKVNVLLIVHCPKTAVTVMVTVASEVAMNAGMVAFGPEADPFTKPMAAPPLQLMVVAPGVVLIKIASTSSPGQIGCTGRPAIVITGQV